METDQNEIREEENFRSQQQGQFSGEANPESQEAVHDDCAADETSHKKHHHEKHYSRYRMFSNHSSASDMPQTFTEWTPSRSRRW